MSTGPDPERRPARVRASELSQLRDGMRGDQRAIDSGFASLAESLSEVTRQLLQAARDARFEAPAWPGGADRAIELRLSETREVTLRLTEGRDA